MACSHTTGCPLFPKLNASLRGWRDAYCDSETGWQGCARYTQSLTGQSVPITLLPNGKYAHTMVRTGDVAVATQRSRFDSLPRVAAAPGSPFEEAPPAAPARVAPSVWDDAPQPTPRPTLPPNPAAESPVLVRPAPAPPVRQPTPPPTQARAGWWTRLVEWMRGPA